MPVSPVEPPLHAVDLPTIGGTGLGLAVALTVVVLWAKANHDERFVWIAFASVTAALGITSAALLKAQLDADPAMPGNTFLPPHVLTGLLIVSGVFAAGLFLYHLVRVVDNVSRTLNGTLAGFALTAAAGSIALGCDLFEHSYYGDFGGWRTVSFYAMVSAFALTCIFAAIRHHLGLSDSSAEPQSGAANPGAPERPNHLL